MGKYKLPMLPAVYIPCFSPESREWIHHTWQVFWLKAPFQKPSRQPRLTVALEFERFSFLVFPTESGRQSIPVRDGDEMLLTATGIALDFHQLPF